MHGGRHHGSGQGPAAPDYVDVTTAMPVDVGDIIIIEGHRLKGIRSIVFAGGAIAVSLAIVGCTRIAVQVPDGAVTGPVTVIGANRIWVSSTDVEVDHMCVTLSSIAIAPSSVTDNVGYTGQLVATGTYSDASTANLTSAVLWATSNAAIATITNGANGGDVALVGAGAANITASLLGVTSNTVVATANGTPIEYGTTSGLPTTQSTGLSDRVYERAFVFPTDSASVTMYISNRVPPTYVNQAVAGTNIAVYTSDGIGGVTGSPDTFLAQTIPLPGVAGTGLAEFLGPLTVTVPAGIDGKRVVRVSIPAGSPTVSICDVQHHGIYYTGTQSVTAPGTSAGDALISPYTIHFRATTLKRRLLVLGDSISVGATLSYVATTGYEDSAYYQLGEDNDWAVNIQGRPGATINELANVLYGPPPGGTSPEGGREWDTVEDLLSGVDVIIQRGTNDVSLGLASMQADLATVIAHLDGAGVRRIYTQTIPPALAWTAHNATRNSYNAWVVANWVSLGLYAAPTDIDLALRDPGDATSILPAYTTDGTHMTPAGQTVILAAWQAVL